MRLDAAADALVRCELATLDARCADLKRKSGLGDVAESSDSEASQNGVVEEETPASPAPAVSEEAPAAVEEAPPAAEEDSPEAAEAKAALAGKRTRPMDGRPGMRAIRRAGAKEPVRGRAAVLAAIQEESVHMHQEGGAAVAAVLVQRLSGNLCLIL